MEILNLLDQNNILNVAVVIGVIALMSQMRKYFLDALIEKIRLGWLKWLVVTMVALVLSIGLTAITQIAGFSFGAWVKMSIMNWIFCWVFHDTVKNLFFKG